MTVVHPPARFGVELDKYLITKFEEKPQLQGWINGGFLAHQKFLNI